jgi:hypothetical protein
MGGLRVHLAPAGRALADATRGLQGLEAAGSTQVFRLILCRFLGSTSFTTAIFFMACHITPLEFSIKGKNTLPIVK